MNFNWTTFSIHSQVDPSIGVDAEKRLTNLISLDRRMLNNRYSTAERFLDNFMEFRKWMEINISQWSDFKYLIEIV